MLIAAVLVASGCGGGGHVDAPTISVVTTIAPLAQMVAAIGGSTVSVLDLARPGLDPRTAPLSAADTAQIHRAALVVDVGGGFQPAVEAAGTTGRVVTLSSTLGPPTDDPWLDPVAMQREAKVVAGALAAANPRAAGRYANGERDYFEQLASVAIDYQSGLVDCARKVIAAPDRALGGVAAQYRLRLVQVGAITPPDPAQVGRAAAAVNAAGVRTVFREPWVPAATVDAVAAATGAQVRTFDTLEAPPAGGWPKGATYITLLETNLAALTSALTCSTNNES